MKYFIVLVILLSCTLLYAETYSTWDVLEPDTCASAWLIKRFVDKDASFKFYVKGELITEGIPFDTPDAELRRRHGMSTFESIIKKYNITDPSLLKIGELIHQIEINYWVTGENKEADKLNDAINKIISENTDPQETLKKVFAFMDKFYSSSRPSVTSDE